MAGAGGRVILGATVSLDGFVADDQDGIDEIFGWYGNGDEHVTTANPDVSASLSETDAQWWRSFTGRLGAVLVGRRLFDITDGWGGVHPLGAPVVVLTHVVPEEWVAAHPDCGYRFVTSGPEEAVAEARDVAGPDADIALEAGDVGAQCLAAGLVDAVLMDLAPVVLGHGRPFFGSTPVSSPVRFGEPRVVQGVGAVHLLYEVQPTGLGQVSGP